MQRAEVFCSPDARFIGLLAERKWKRVDLSSGSAQTLCDGAEFSWGASWGAEEKILFVPFYGSGLSVVSAQGGTPVSVTTIDAARMEVAHLWPFFLPDGVRFLFFARARRGQDDREGWICAASLGSKEVRRLRPADALVGASPEHLFFSIEGVRQSQRFDPARLDLLGEPRIVPGRVAHQGEVAGIQASVSRNGVLAARTDPPPQHQLVFFDRTGKRLATVGPPGAYEESLRLSPDGRRVAIVARHTQTSVKELWLVDIARGTASRLGSGKNEELRPVWSPDGIALLFSHDRGGPYDLVERSVHGSGADKEYFREMMREHRKRARQESEEMKRFLADSRSGTLLLTEEPHLESLDGFVQDLDAFIQIHQDIPGDSGFGAKSTFSMDRYRSHILSCLPAEGVHFSDIAQVDEDIRRDRAWRFITLVFMQNEWVIDLIQEGDNIWVQRLQNEPHA